MNLFTASMPVMDGRPCDLPRPRIRAKHPATKGVAIDVPLIKRNPGPLLSQDRICCPGAAMIISTPPEEKVAGV
jgi:hypothetical protein